MHVGGLAPNFLLGLGSRLDVGLSELVGVGSEHRELTPSKLAILSLQGHRVLVGLRGLTGASPRDQTFKQHFQALAIPVTRKGLIPV